MPRGKYFTPEQHEAARQLRRQGLSLREIGTQLGIAKNTLSAWLRDIELTPDQQERLRQTALQEGFHSEHARFLASAWHRRQKLERIEAQRQKAEGMLGSLHQTQHANHIAAAMLYLAEGSKGRNVFVFANSNPDIIKYWLYLLRTSFEIDESKFRLRIMARADQNIEEIATFWQDVTQVYNYMKVNVDPRTVGKSATYPDYKGVCAVQYVDTNIRRYLDAVAHGLIQRAIGATSSDAAPSSAF